jgi:maleylacetoacetate isomerase
MLILHGYWLSLATYRVRVALKLKGVPFEERMHDLSSGQQHQQEFLRLNPASTVPVLEGGTPEPLTQSLAILEWLEETYTTTSLLPPDAAGRARVRGMFLLTAADTHPLVVPRVQKRLFAQFGANAADGREWAAHWFREGLTAYDALLSDGATRCHGETLSLADLGLASHVIGAERFGINILTYTRVAAVSESLFKLPEFASSHPRHQAGAIAT